jgi:hypothetical protein
LMSSLIKLFLLAIRLIVLLRVSTIATSLIHSKVDSLKSFLLISTCKSNQSSSTYSKFCCPCQNIISISSSVVPQQPL